MERRGEEWTIAERRRVECGVVRYNIAEYQVERNRNRNRNRNRKEEKDGRCASALVCWC